MNALGGLHGGHRVRDDTGARLHECPAVRYEGRADDDAGVEFAVSADVPDAPAVGAPPHALGGADEFGCAQLGGAGESAHGHGGAEGVQRIQVRVELSADLGDQMHDTTVAVHAQQVPDLASAGHAHPGDVVAGQIDQHDVLCDLLGIRAQFQLQADVPLMVDASAGRQAARPSARDGTDGDLSGGRRVQQGRLGGGSQQLEARGADVEHVRAGVGLAQLVVGGQGIGTGEDEAAGGHDLVDLPGGDRLLHLLHRGGEAGVGDSGSGVHDGTRSARGRAGRPVGVGGVSDGGSVDGGGQHVHARGEVLRINGGPHEGGLARGVVDDQDDARVVEEVVGAGVGPHRHIREGLEGGQVVEGDDAGHQRQVGMVHLSVRQDLERLNGGAGRQALSFFQGAVVRSSGNAQREGRRGGR